MNLAETWVVLSNLSGSRRIKLGVSELVFQAPRFGAQTVDFTGQCFQRMLLLEAQPSPVVIALGLGFHLRFALPPFGFCTPQLGATLSQHIGIAAGVFAPGPAAFRRENRADDAVEKVAVVADEQHGPS